MIVYGVTYHNTLGYMYRVSAKTTKRDETQVRSGSFERAGNHRNIYYMKLPLLRCYMKAQPCSINMQSSLLL